MVTTALDTLALATAEALEAAGLSTLRDVVLEQMVPRLHERDPLWMELTLLEIRTLARHPHYSREMRQRWVLWVLTVTGW